MSVSLVLLDEWIEQLKRFSATTGEPIAEIVQQGRWDCAANESS